MRFFIERKKFKDFFNEGLASQKNALIIRSPEGRKTLLIATLAQLVERNLAKVEVTSSNLVCRSKFRSDETAHEEPRAQAGRVTPDYSSHRTQR